MPANDAFAVATLEFRVKDASDTLAPVPARLLQPGASAAVLRDLTHLVHDQLGSAHLMASALAYKQGDVGWLWASVTIGTDDADALDASTLAPGLGGLADTLAPRLSRHVQEEGPGLRVGVIPSGARVELQPNALAAASKEPPLPKSPRELTKAQKAGAMRWALGVGVPLAAFVLVMALEIG